MSRIEQLPPNVVNKIAAGEVIERPASVVKELMENSVDAGSRRIDVSIQQGGSQLIRVVDDGGGVAADQLRLAVTSHATSKIRSDEDLFHVGSLGFRGEALASIASVSRLNIRSRTPDAEAGTEMEIVGGQESEVTPSACPVGTVIEVHDLFFNTPVRRKFLRTTQTEMGHITEMLTRLALAYPKIHFTLTHNGRQIHELTPADGLRDRVAVFFGSELADALIGVESVEDDVRLSGFVANPSYSRGNNRMQYLFLNGRHIRDRSLQHAMSEAYRGLLLTGRYPICFLKLDMPPESVDVNVHPTKLEVRFKDGGKLYSQLLGTLRTRFLSTDLTARLRPTAPEDPTGAADPVQADQLRRSVDQWANAGVTPSPSSGGLPAAAVAPTTSPNTASGGVMSTQTSPAQIHPAGGPDLFGTTGAASPGGTESAPMHLGPRNLPTYEAAAAVPGTTADNKGAERSPMPHSPANTGADSSHAMQVMNRYLIAETEDGVVVVDQHALHERILYEEIRERVLAGTMESQNLLVPEPVDLSAAEAAAVIEAQELLEQLAVKVKPFGGSTILVESYPAMLANWNPTELLRNLADQLTGGGKAPDRRDLLDELLHMISCKAAIKAGDRLTSAEVSALLEQRDLAQDAHHCPHGRPTALLFTREELDKQFKRT